MSRKVGNSKFFLQILVFALVEPILEQKKANCSVSTADLEAMLDRLVYELYDLNASEIATIEKAIV
jgi:hypothetical protein